MQQADRLILNVLSNYLLTLVTGVAGLIMVPVVMRDLGAAGYGLSALLLAAFVGVQTLSDGANRAVQRYVPHDLASETPERASGTFSSAMLLFAVLGAAAAILILGFRAVYLEAPGIDESQRAEARVVLGLIFASLVLGSPLNVYRAGLEALQRYDVVSLRVGVAMALRALLVIALFELGRGSISLVVASQVIATLASGLWCRAALRRELPWLQLSPRNVQAGLLRALAAFSFGVMLVAIGNLLGTEGFRLLVGHTLGMSQVGMLSALLAFRTMASTLIENMSNVLTPAVSTLEARGSSRRLGELLITSTKYGSVAAALICVVPLAVARSFLGLWLGEQALPYAPVMFAILVGQIPVIVSAGAQQVVVGLGRARLAGSIVVVRGLASLTAALLYLQLAEAPTLLGATLSLYAVQVAGALAMFVFGARATAAGVRVLFRDALARPLALAAIGAGITALAAVWIGSTSWLRLALCVSLGEGAFLLLVLAVGLDARERDRLRAFALRARRWAS
jgi:O-antigen/teichoic acid export membrane protein